MGITGGNQPADKLLTCSMTAPRPEPRIPSVHDTSASQTLLYSAWLAWSSFAQADKNLCMEK